MLARAICRSCSAFLRYHSRMIPPRVAGPVSGRPMPTASLWMIGRVQGSVLPGLQYMRSVCTNLKPIPKILITASPPTAQSRSVKEGKPVSARKAMSTAQSTPPQSIVSSLPAAMQPYALLARLDKPIGTWLLLWPCMWSIAIVAPVGALPDLWMMTKFSIGAFVMRGAGCTINDLWDMDIDSKVERTKTRPLAAGLITKEQAIVFLGLQLTAGLSVLLSLNLYSIVLGAASMGLVIVYPLMKRVTHWPQLVLGLTFNWGALLGASAVLGSCPWHICLPMYAGSVAWTLMYDTIYAHQDKVDDVKVGVKSTALLLAEHTKPALVVFGSCFLAGLVGTGLGAGMGAVYFGGVVAAAGHLAWQIRTVDLDTPAECMAKFVSNSRLGALLCAAVVLDKLCWLPLLA